MAGGDVTRTMYALTPSYRPVGGVIKVFDYVLHAVALGYEVRVACPRPFDPELPLFRVPGFEALSDSPSVTFLEGLRIAPEVDDLVFFSWPTHGVDIAARLPAGFPLPRIIHIIQNVRHANPRFADGFAVRMLSRPMSRIVINDQVLDAIRPFLDDRHPTEVIPLGHRTEYFAQERSGGLGSPLRVGYTTWKSAVGHEVRAQLEHDPRFTFRAIEDEVDWATLRDLYHWCDVFLGTPNVEEGFYLPGLEAMAAGAIVVISDAGGNMTYCRFDENCLGVAFEDADGYVAALEELASASDARIQEIRRAGDQRVKRHDLAREQASFAELVQKIDHLSESKGRFTKLPQRERSPGRDVLLTGVPRSGTTLLTHLLNDLEDVVALSEPIRPTTFMQGTATLDLVHRYADFVHRQRATILQDGVARSKTIRGEDTDNYFTEQPDADGLRRDVANVQDIAVEKSLSPDFILVVKDLPMTTALLRPLRERFDTFAMVRNPLAVLASWTSVDIPMRNGRAPHAEWFDEDLGRQLYEAGEGPQRVITLLRWWFERITEVLPPERVVRYEDLVRAPAEQIVKMIPNTDPPQFRLRSRNRNPIYVTDELNELGAALLSSEGAYWHWYERSEAESLLEDLLGNAGDGHLVGA